MAGIGNVEVSRSLDRVVHGPCKSSYEVPQPSLYNSGSVYTKRLFLRTGNVGSQVHFPKSGNFLVATIG
jgi:hypothetical protein